MADGNSLIDFGDLSKPVTTLIEKASDAVGGLFKPWQIKRIARAEAEAKKIWAAKDIEITDMQQRAIVRNLHEQGKHQQNMEHITAGAIPLINPGAKPEQIEEDWLTYFFSKARIVSDEMMQSLWSRLLAGEANAPYSYSKRTIDFVSTLDKSDAELFTQLCTFNWLIEDEFYPLIYLLEDEIYEQFGISYESLTHLDTIGLISFRTIEVQGIHIPLQKVWTSYYEKPVILEFLKTDKSQHSVDIGHVTLTRVGKELVLLCGSRPSEDFFAHILSKWYARYSVSSPWPRSASG